VKRAGRYIAIGFLALTAVAGIANAINEAGVLDTALQNSVAFADALWGVLGIAAAVGIWKRRPWAVGVSVAWGVTVAYTATVASFAFSDPTFSQPGTLTGAIAAGTATLVIAGLIVWAARVATREQPAVPPPAA
jgi:hypothetical protein